MKRKIKEDLRRWIDRRFFLVSDDPIRYTSRALFIKVMKIFGEAGIIEDDGDNKSKDGLIEWIQSTVGDVNREPWCCSLIQSAVAYVEITLNVECSLPVTEHCITMFDEGKKAGLCVGSDVIVPGDLMVWRFSNSNRGHVEAVIQPGDELISTIGGNTSLGDGVVREGNGVFPRLRSKFGTKNMPLYGFLRLKFKPVS